MVNRLKIELTQEEFNALLTLSLKELRTPPDQVHFILRAELVRLGFFLGEKNGIAENPTGELGKG